MITTEYDDSSPYDVYTDTDPFDIESDPFWNQPNGPYGRYPSGFSMDRAIQNTLHAFYQGAQYLETEIKTLIDEADQQLDPVRKWPSQAQKRIEKGVTQMEHAITEGQETLLVLADLAQSLAKAKLITQLEDESSAVNSFKKQAQAFNQDLQDQLKELKTHIEQFPDDVNTIGKRAHKKVKKSLKRLERKMRRHLSRGLHNFSVQLFKAAQYTRQAAQDLDKASKRAKTQHTPRTSNVTTTFERVKRGSKTSKKTSKSKVHKRLSRIKPFKKR